MHLHPPSAPGPLVRSPLPLVHAAMLLLRGSRRSRLRCNKAACFVPHHFLASLPVGAPTQQPAQQPGGFTFGAGGGTTAGGSTSLPAFSTTAFGVGATSQAGATMGAPQTGSMTLGAAPGEAGGTQRRKVKLRRPGRK